MLGQLRIARAGRIAGLPYVAIAIECHAGPRSIIVRVGDAPRGIKTVGRKRPLRRTQFLLLAVIACEHEVIAVARQISVSEREIHLARGAAGSLRAVEIRLAL